MSTTDPNKKKRAGKRYVYSRAAQCEVDGQILEVQMLNISASGIQFAARTKIETTNAIKVRWVDTQYGKFDPTLVIKRELHKPEYKEFQYYYGSQYYNLSNEAKHLLLQLLKNFKLEEKQLQKQQAEKITPNYLFEVIEEGTAFLRRILSGGQPEPYFDNIVSQIVDYEKTAFMLDDEVSQCIQKLTTHNFHCNLLGLLTSVVAEKSELKPTFFEYVQVELHRIQDVENEVENVSKTVVNRPDKNEENSKTQLRLNESSNRLFYTKQNLLQSIVGTFGSLEAESPELQERFATIKEAHEKLKDLTGRSFQQLITYDRRAAEPEKTTTDSIVDIPIQSAVSTQTNYRIYVIGVLVAIISVIYFSAHWFGGESNVQVQKEMELGIQPIKNERVGQQINITFRESDWNGIPAEQKKQMALKILDHLKKDKTLHSCVIFDEHNNVLRILYKNMSTQVLF